MSLPSNYIYAFGNFRFESGKLVLWHGQDLIKNLGLQPLKVLAALLRHEGVVTYDEILEDAWPEQKQDSVDDTNIKPHISALRKVFTELEPDSNYIQTFPSRGYSFTGASLVIAADMTGQTEEQDIEAVNANPRDTDIETIPGSNKPIAATEAASTAQNDIKRSPKPGSTKIAIFVACGFFILIIAGIFLLLDLSTREIQPEKQAIIHSAADEELIRRVVEESQNYETLVVYTNPQAFDEQALKQYFVEPADGGQEPQKIKKAVENLIQKGLHYGPESRREAFNFISVEIYSPGDHAEVRTEESWYIPAYQNDGTRNLDTKIRFQVKPTYYLKKIRGQWLIEENTTARKKPSPSEY